MVILSASEISKSFGSDEIIRGVSFHINEGDRVGIVGDNGAGKSTLLSILTGQLAHDSGSLFLSSKVDFGYLKQNGNFSSENTVYMEMISIFSELIQMEERIQKLSNIISEESSKGNDTKSLLTEYDQLLFEFESNRGFTYQSEVRGILSSMAFNEDSYDKKISTLSGGERTRLALAALLLRNPELLFLDEPTNHLDLGTLKWLEQYLENYKGTLVIVSHDRYFLDRTINRIFEIQNSTLSSYEGNYSAYLHSKKLREEDALKNYELQRQEISRQEEMIRRFKQHGTEKLAKRAKSREKRLERIQLAEAPQKSRKNIRFNFKERFESGNDVLTARNLSISFGDLKEKRILFSDLDFDIKRGERICILGANGIGKTTLLNIIMGKLIPDTGFVRQGHNVVAAYYDQQHAQLHSDLTVLEELHGSYRLYSETELRSLLGRFSFINDDVFKKVKDLSGGERAKLSLLKLMLSGANLLIMDEPTNHLDISAKEAFEDAISAFPGTVIIVSHDRYLLNKIPSRIMELTQAGISSYLGTYDYYLEKKESIGSGKSYLGDLSKITSLSNPDDNELDKATIKEEKARARRKAKEEEAKRRKLERNLEDAEKTILHLEKEIADLEKELCRQEIFTDHNLSNEYSLKLADTKESLKVAYDNWEKLHEEI